MRRQFWQIVVPLALKAKDKELAAGLDATGEPLNPIKERTRKNRRSAMTPSGKGDPSAPPLMPAYQKSRVRSLLAGRAFATHAELYWRYDPFTGASFDEILNYQKKAGRDVFGISKDGLAAVRKAALAAWAKFKKSGAAPTEVKTAFPSVALTAGPQSRIAGIISRSALPNAGATAPRAVGSMSTRWITRGIGAPKVAELKASTTRSGAMSAADWRKFWTAEEGRAGPRPARPTAPKPVAPRPAPLVKLLPKPVTKPGAAIVSTPVFARQALSAARAVPESVRYTESVVWIIDAYNAYVARHGPISLTEFKAQLVEAHRAGLLILKRFDLPGALSEGDFAKDAASLTRYGIAEFNQIRI